MRSEAYIVHLWYSVCLFAVLHAELRQAVLDAM